MVAELTIVARAYEEESMDKLFLAGADQVVSPNRSAAIRMASVLLRPSVVSFLDIATRSQDIPLRMEELSVGEGSRVTGRTLAEVRIPEETGLVVIAVRKSGAGGSEFCASPAGGVHGKGPEADQYGHCDNNEHGHNGPTPVSTWSSKAPGHQDAPFRSMLASPNTTTAAGWTGRRSDRPTK